jgi:hypothetical protein
MTRTLGIRVGAGLLIGAAALSLAACGATIKPEGAAQSVVDLVSKQTDFKPSSSARSPGPRTRPIPRT